MVKIWLQRKKWDHPSSTTNMHFWSYSLAEKRREKIAKTTKPKQKKTKNKGWILHKCYFRAERQGEKKETAAFFFDYLMIHASLLKSDSMYVCMYECMHTTRVGWIEYQLFTTITGGAHWEHSKVQDTWDRWRWLGLKDRRSLVACLLDQLSRTGPIRTGSWGG